VTSGAWLITDRQDRRTDITSGLHTASFAFTGSESKAAAEAEVSQTVGAGKFLTQVKHDTH